MNSNPENKYLSRQYAATDFSFPYVQGQRGEDPKQYGYFVPLSQASKAGWRDLDPDKLTEYTYNSGQTEVGILLQQPRMTITPVCQLGMFDRKASQEEETLVVIGKWDRQHRGDENIGNFQIYLVMFFDEHQQPLHDLPLKLVAKGAHQATDKSARKNRTIRSRIKSKKETKRKAKTQCQSAKSARRERDKIE